MRQQFLSSMACALMAMAAFEQVLPPSPPPHPTPAQPAVSPLLIQPPLMPMPAEGMVRIRGVITQVRQVGNATQPVVKIRIVESTSAGRGRDLAVVLITGFTPVTVVHEGKSTSASLQLLNVGQTVEVGLSSLMKPANPVQASALEITILE